MKKRSRLGVDIGGTFTDVVLEHQGKLYSNKVLTTFDIPEDAIIEGIKGVCQKSGVLPGEIEQIIHGTTLATNSLIERRGAKIALITTEGFRDVIEMRTESRFEQYDLNLVLPTPLVPRNCRYTLNERVDAQGSILKELRQEDVDKLIDVIEVANFESVAVGFIHSYLNPSHERMLEKSLRERLPHVSVSLSSAVSPQMREYERFNTVCANAFVKPMMKSYLDRLTNRLSEQEVNCPVFLMHSGGGIISLDSATEFPVRLIESGPAGGAIFAAKIAERHDLDKVLSFDMGGTTAKICLIKDKSPKTARVFEVARTYRFKKGSGMPISIPVIDMVEIGAGGGSLANIDSMNQIRVGPESAGSKPGPACYDLGGNRPAVTDADLLLGRLDGDNFAGGSINLSVEKSKVALRKEIGEALSMEPIESAFGVSEVVDENMANAARMHAVENGEDLAEFTMIAFGGAAPLHAARLCQKLGIKKFIVPSGAGVGSAIGFLRAPFSFEATKSVFMPLGKFNQEVVLKILKELTTESTSFVKNCGTEEQIVIEAKAYMRYSGQGWEIPVIIDSIQMVDPTKNKFQEAFELQYKSLFGRLVQGLDVEITVWSVNAVADTVSEYSESIVVSNKSKTELESTKVRNLFDPALGKFTEARIADRKALNSASYFTGPAVLVEDETTIIIPTNFISEGREDGSIVVKRVDQ